MKILERKVSLFVRRRFLITREGFVIEVRRHRRTTRNQQAFYTSERLVVPWRKPKIRDRKSVV